MAETRTEREKLVEAREIVDGVIHSIAEGTGSQITLYEALVLRDALAAADLLSGEREPDCYLVEIQGLGGVWRKVPVPYGRASRFSDLRDAMEEAKAYRADGIPVRVRALYPGSVLEAHDGGRNPEEVVPGALEARGYER